MSKGTTKRVQHIHGVLAIGVLAIEDPLYVMILILQEEILVIVIYDVKLQLDILFKQILRNFLHFGNKSTI